VDIGNGYVKAKTADTDVSFPSVLAKYDKRMEDFDLSLKAADRFIIGYRQNKYAVGDTVHFEGLLPISTAHRSRLSTEYYRVLFAAALSEVLHESADVSIVASLPPAAYWDRDQQRAVISGLYEVQKATRGGSVRTFKWNVEGLNIRIIPEGVGSICTMALDESGREQRDSFMAHASVGVVDIGTYTTDLIHLDGLRIVRSGCESMPKTALHAIQDQIRTYVSSHGVDMPPDKADRAMHEGFFLKNGERIPLADVRDSMFSDLAQSISSQIRTTWNGGNDVEYIIVTGGGAPWVERLLEFEFKHVRLIAGVPPFFANCEGGFRYGLLRERAERKRGR
jgi:hypothetical protein